MSISNDNVTIIAKTDSINIAVDNQNIDVNTYPQEITVKVGSTLTTSSGSFVIGETPSGVINGSNATFTTLQSFVPLTVELILNSTIQTYGIDYTTSGTNTINLNVSPIIGDIIRVNYKLG